MSKRAPKRKQYTVEQANAMLPLLKQILRDITVLARDLNDRYERLSRLQNTGASTSAHSEELETTVAEYERDQAKMREFEDELAGLGVELKDYFVGLVDFRCLMDGREVYLCWRLDEPAVEHWHELDSGFASRQKLIPSEVSR